MADETGSVASLFGGQPGDGGAPPAPAPGSAPQATAPTGGIDDVAKFVESFDPTSREWVAKKGWKSAADVASSYKELEKLVGGEEAMDQILSGLFTGETNPSYPYLTWQDFLDACNLSEEDLNLG